MEKLHQLVTNSPARQDVLHVSYQHTNKSSLKFVGDDVVGNAVESFGNNGLIQTLKTLIKK